MNAPSKIWMCSKEREAPDWVLERMTTAEIASDGSFEIEASDGIVKVEAGHVVFVFADQVFACHPRTVPDKMRTAAPEQDEPAPAKRAASPAPSPEPRKLAGSDRPLKLKPIIGAPCAPQFCQIEQLTVDDTYQRSIEGGASQTLIRRMAENWDYRLCLPLIVSRRAGKLYVIDGQHRKEAAELRGDIPHLPCIVFDFDDPKQEAELFVAANRSRRPMSLLDDHHAAVISGDKKALAINAVVTGAGLTVARIKAYQYWRPGEVVFVKAIGTALAKAGKEVVEQALGIIARAFDGLVLTGVGAVFTGLITLMQERAKDGAPIDPGLMQIVLAEVGIPGWKEVIDGADSGFDRNAAMLAALKAAYAEAEAQ